MLLFKCGNEKQGGLQPLQTRPYRHCQPYAATFLPVTSTLRSLADEVWRNANAIRLFFIGESISNSRFSEYVSWAGGVFFNFFADLGNKNAQILSLIAIFWPPNLSQ